MSITHEINKEAKLIETTISGEPTEREMIDALAKYQAEIKREPEYFSFHELVDCSAITGKNITTPGVKQIVAQAVKSDRFGPTTKLAFVVSSQLSYGLTRMYEVYRNQQSAFSKEIGIFEKRSDAYEWLITSA